VLSGHSNNHRATVILGTAQKQNIFLEKFLLIMGFVACYKRRIEN
jgi:hypothetical protein